MSEISNQSLLDDINEETYSSNLDSICLPMDENNTLCLKPKSYTVELLPSEIKFFNEFLSRERSSCKNFRIAKAMLLLDEGLFTNRRYTLKEVAEESGFCEKTLYKMKRNFFFYGIDGVLGERIQKNPSRMPKLDGEQEARLISIACSDAPLGRARWTLQLLKDKLIELKVVENISTATIYRVLKNNNLKPHKSEYYKIPDAKDRNFVALMEDIIRNCYLREQEEGVEVIAMDETCLQLLEHIIQPLPTKPGHVKKVDPEYKRKDVVDVFVMTNPNRGYRYLEVCKSRCCKDWANFMKKIADEIYPNAKKIILVCDNLNTHTKGSFYEAFSPDEAARLCDKFEFHYTPVHASWLNIAEVEIARYKKECLEDRRISTIEELKRETESWMNESNCKKCTIKWQFTTEDARTKLIHLYPKIEELCSPIINTTEQKEENLPKKKLKTKYCEKSLEEAREARSKYIKQELDDQKNSKSIDSINQSEKATSEKQSKTIPSTQYQEKLCSKISVKESQKNTYPTQSSFNTDSQQNETLISAFQQEKNNLIKIENTPYEDKKRLFSTMIFSIKSKLPPLLPSIREWQESI